MDDHQVTRRPIKSRDARWAKATAAWLTRHRVSPNQISILSVIFSIAFALCLYLARYQIAPWRILLLILASICIPMRLLCNMLDGMVAVEGGMKSKSGDFYNEFPDRLSDLITLVSAGSFISAPCCGSQLGWTAGAIAQLIAYVRCLGQSGGAKPDFSGPMAKQQRMIFVIVGCLLSAIEIAIGWPQRAMTYCLLVVIVGGVFTLIRRTVNIVRELESL